MEQSVTPIKDVTGLMAKLKTDSDCRTYLKKLLWNSETTPLACPKCGNTVTYTLKDGRTHLCAGCRRKFNLFTGTIFENTKLPLQKWVLCIWMASSYKRGISSHQVARNLGVTQKTAWFMMQRIRKLLEQLKATNLEGLCTADEAFIGGKQKNKHKDKRVKGQAWRGKSEKINVFGVMQVNGHVITKMVTDVSSKTLKSLLLNYVKPGSTIMTDEWLGYNGIESHFRREICQHARYEYVSKTGATTNPIENYWSHMKRAIIGTYYKLSRKHIERYLTEFDFKFNYRSLHDSEKFNLVLSQLHNSRLKYAELIK